MLRGLAGALALSMMVYSSLPAHADPALRGLRIGMTAEEFRAVAATLGDGVTTSIETVTVPRTDMLDFHVLVETSPPSIPSVRACMDQLRAERIESDKRRDQQRAANAGVPGWGDLINRGITEATRGDEMRKARERRYGDEELRRQCVYSGDFYGNGSDYELARARINSDGRVEWIRLQNNFIYGDAGYGARAANVGPADFVRAFGERLGVTFVASGEARTNITTHASQCIGAACVRPPPTETRFEATRWTAEGPAACNCVIIIQSSDDRRGIWRIVLDPKSQPGALKF